MIMKKSVSPFLLYIIIILEGYVVLSSELLAIRQTTPYFGSGTDTISIIIAAVLMPLAVGYYVGGRFKIKDGKTVRKRLVFNILASMIFLLPGLSYIVIGQLHGLLTDYAITGRLLHASLYASIFISPPVYLLGQTIPLISNYFNKEKLSKVTGRILFFSTLGSFLGAIFSTLILMSHFGVNNTVCVIFIILPMLVFVLNKEKFSGTVLFATVLGIFGLILNSNLVMHANGIIDNNLYNTISVMKESGENGESRHLILNNNYSSKYTDDGRKYDIIEFSEQLAIDPILYARPRKNILVIGAGAFTFGHQDKHNHYDFVDIDKNLKQIAEEHILLEEIGENKTFHPTPARAFLAATDKKYDVIFLDTYLGHHTIPEHLLTQEFFQQVKSCLSDNGLMLANIVSAPNFNSSFSRRLDNTIRSVFPQISRDVMRDRYMLWNNEPDSLANVVYIYKHHPDADLGIYTDDLNRAFLDKP